MVIEKVITAAIVAKTTLPCEKNPNIEAFVIITG